MKQLFLLMLGIALTLNGFGRSKELGKQSALNKTDNAVLAPIFYLAENGVTIKCNNCSPGDKGVVDGITYEAVDELLLRQRIEEGADLGKLCTSLVTDMSNTFYLDSIFNQDISSWDVSNVTNMSYLFAGASTFNQDISFWDVSNVRYMNGMFSGASAFNRNIGIWDVQNVNNMDWMFADANSFNQDLSNWCVVNVTLAPTNFALHINLPSEYFPNWGTCYNPLEPDFYMDTITFNSEIIGYTVKCENCVPGNTGTVNGILYEAVNNTSLKQKIENGDDLSVLCTTLVTNMSSGADGFFRSGFFNQDISTWDVSNVTDMSNMFRSAGSFNQNISAWDVGSVTSMSGMFYDATSFNQDIGFWDVSDVTDMTSMFFNASSFIQDLSHWCVKNIPSEPDEFAAESNLPGEYYPIWGTCGIITDIKDISENQLKIYPNPAMNYFWLEYNRNETCWIKIVNLMGQVVYHKKLMSNRSRIELSDWSKKGMYFVIISNSDNELVGVKKISIY